jgi:hypothetical protein
VTRNYEELMGSLPAPTPKQELLVAPAPIDTGFRAKPTAEPPLLVEAAPAAEPLPVPQVQRESAPAPPPRDDQGGVLSSGMSHEHEHRALADSLCPQCHHLWVIS